MTFAHFLTSGSQQMVPQVVKTRSNGPGVRSGGLIYGPLDEVCLQASLIGQTPCNIQRGTGKIESGNSRAAPYQAQRVPTDMALQMQNALSRDVAEFGRFNRM